MTTRAKTETPFISTGAGKVIAKSMIRLDDCTIFPNDADDDLKETAYFAVGLLESGSDPVWCLFYEQGGDWAYFEDGAEYDVGRLSDWMPDAVEDCVKTAAALLGEAVEDDMRWFRDWAKAARATLARGR